MSDYITKDWLSAELQKVHSVVIYINSSRPGVNAPKAQMSKPSFTLLLSHHFDRPLIFRKDDFKSDFLFENGFETCTIPWNAIWAAHPDSESHKICFWNQNSPGEGWDKALCDFLELKTVPGSAETIAVVQPATAAALKDNSEDMYSDEVIDKKKSKLAALPSKPLRNVKSIKSDLSEDSGTQDSSEKSPVPATQRVRPQLKLVK